MEIIDLSLDEINDLCFNVMIEGTATGPVLVRLLCELDDISYIFNGIYTEKNEVKVIIPAMKKNGFISENKAYKSRLEVMVENRIFIPLEFSVQFKEKLKVFAEVITNKQTDSITETKNSLVTNNETKTVITKQKPIAITASISKAVQNDDVKIANIVENKTKPENSKSEIVRQKQNKIFKTLAEKLKK